MGTRSVSDLIHIARTGNAGSDQRRNAAQSSFMSRACRSRVRRASKAGNLADVSRAWRSGILFATDDGAACLTKALYVESETHHENNTTQPAVRGASAGHRLRQAIGAQFDHRRWPAHVQQL